MRQVWRAAFARKCPFLKIYLSPVCFDPSLWAACNDSRLLQGGGKSCRASTATGENRDRREKRGRSPCRGDRPHRGARRGGARVQNLRANDRETGECR